MRAENGGHFAYTLASGGHRVELLRGTVTNVRPADAGDAGVRPSKGVLVDIAGRTVVVQVRGGAPIQDGDDVAVWVRRRGGLDHAVALRNATRDVMAYPFGLAARSLVGLLATLGGGYVVEGLYTGRWGARMDAGTFGLCLACAGLAVVAGLLLMFSGARWSARLRAL
jgi:hypothetical protein